MFSLRLRKATQTRYFCIADGEASGWDVREEQDGQIVRAVRYLDWHRVERAKRAFERQRIALREDGWVEV